MLKRVLLIYLSSAAGLFAGIKVSDPAPTFFAKTLDKKSFFLSDSLERNQRPIVLSFFATWCGPCRIEMPVLDTLSQSYNDIDFYLINVSGLEGKKKEDPVEVKALLEKLGVTLPVLMDKYGNAAQKYEALVLPRLVVIDSKGKIAYAHTGYEEGDDKKLIEILNGLKIEDK